MNAIDFNFILNKPNAISERHSLYLDKIVSEFPYFQSARALQLKNLFTQDSFRYNQALKVTAAHTTDRSVLFEFITSGNFASIQKAFFDDKTAKINEIIVSDWEVIDREIQEDLKSSKLEQSIITSIKTANSNGDLVYEGEITDYRVSPMTATADQQASQSRLSITVKVKFTNKKKEEDDFEKSFSFYDDFAGNSLPTGAQLTKSLDLIFERITQDVFNASLAKW